MNFRWQILLGGLLFGLSVAMYLAQIAIFRDGRNTFFYLLQDLAFLPIQVLLVTLIISELLNVREKRSLLKKLNMVIGAFFSEVGTELLKSCSEFDPGVERIRRDLIVTNHWSNKEFAAVRRQLKDYEYRIDIQKSNLEKFQAFLVGKRSFLLGLLENPNLLEHETFTELLWAVFHLTEELDFRKDVNQCSEADCAHIASDIRRAYMALVSEWLSYMMHLKDNYPYLFSLAVRTDPFDPNASPEIK